jgi:hypothetical protein
MIGEHIGISFEELMKRILEIAFNRVLPASILGTRSAVKNVMSKKVGMHHYESVLVIYAVIVKAGSLRLSSSSSELLICSPVMN